MRRPAAPAALLALGLGLALAAPPAAAQPDGRPGPLPPRTPPAHAPVEAPPPTPEVVVSLWTFVMPGMNEKRGCRIRVIVENGTAERFGFFGKFRSLAKGEEKDAWFVSAADVPAKGRAERLFACGQMPDTVEMDMTSDLGYPRTCEVDGDASSPCPLKLRFQSNLPLIGP